MRAQSEIEERLLQFLEQNKYNKKNFSVILIIGTSNTLPESLIYTFYGTEKKEKKKKRKKGKSDLNINIK